MENINQLRKQETPLLFNIDIRGANDLFVIDSETQRWYAPTVGGEVVSHTLPCPDMDRAKEEEQQGPASALALPPLASAAPRVCHVEYVPMNALLYICYESGEVVAHDGVPASTGEVLCIVPGGICTASWAPDGTLGVLVSRASPSAAYLFSCETGTLTPLTTTTTTAASADVRQAHWRGDSEHFLLAGPDGIDVYDRAGVHGSTCIIPDGVTFCPESVAAWRPSGDLIAAVGRNNNSKCIELLLFERAGYLRHRTLLTTVAASVPVTASWNSSSDILAVALWCSEGFDDIAESGMAVELWSVANYQWELKSVLRVPAPQGDNKGMAAFDPEDPLILRVATGHMLVTLRLGRACTVGGAQACAAVIDGTQVRTTYLAKTTMPPPLCASTNTFPCNVLNVGFHCTPEETHAFAVLANNELRVFRVSSADSAAFENIAGTAPLRLPGLSPLLQPQMLTPTTVIGISAPTSLCVADVAASKCTVIATPSPVLALAAGPYRTGGSNSGRCAYCQLADHKIYKVNVENCTVAQTPCGEIPGPVSLLWPALRPRAQQQRQQQQSDAKKKGGKKGAADDGSEDEMLFFGLTSTSRLYMGSLCVSEVCSSFLVHPSFLVYTTLDNKVRFVALETPVTKDSIAKLEAEWPFAQREIERGSVVVGFVKGSGLVLQVPRGNLELIHPRALVLHSLRRLLDRKLYGLAFREARRHRIDLNVLCDHNLTTFISDAEAFVCQVARVDFINIFLSALRDENICSSTYRPPADILAGSTKGASSAATGKVNRVCAAMRDVFRRVDPDKYLLATLTSFAVATPPDIEGALAEVAKLDKEKLEEALDYLAFLCDINALYDVALGTYDIPLVRTVAKKTQKDPREYLPFFDHLESLSLESRCYEIDMLLHRYSLALGHLLNSDEEDKKARCVQLMEKYELYKDALKIFKDDKELYLIVVEKYAAHLSIYNRHEQSATLYETCGKYENAAAEYAECLQWEQAISAIETAASLKQVDDSKKAGFISELAEKLYLNEMYKEAATIFTQWLSDPQRALDILVEGRLWREAWSAATRMGDAGKRAGVVAGILKYTEQYMSDIAEAQDAIIKGAAELENICEREAALQAMGVGTSFAASSESASGCSSAWGSPSETSSVMSSSTSASMSRRRNNKKAKFDKKTMVLQRLLDALPPASLQDELGAILRVLFMGGHRDEAAALQKAFAELIGKAQEALVLLKREVQKPSMLPQADKNRASQWSERDWSLDFI